MSTGSGAENADAEHEDAVLDAVARFLELRAQGDAPSIEAFVAAYPRSLQDEIAQQCGLADQVDEVLGAEAPADDAEDTRRRIGDYAIEREVGRGGWGIVYLAEQLSLRRHVALKVLSGGLTLSKSHLERFRREAAITSGLDDPGIATVYEAGSDGHLTYIAMRYVDGETLSDSIASTRSSLGAARDSSNVHGVRISAHESAERTPRETPRGARARVDVVLEVFEKLARSLHTAHEAQLIHRDIKPGNIRVDRAGQPVLLDFGLARREDDHEDGAALTRSGDVLGTPAYMSPEQLLGNRVALDRRTDIYSLGVTLYESLTLRLPFEAPTRDALYQKILVASPPDPRRFHASIPRDVCTILEVALEKDRERRYSSAADLAEDLRRVRAREPILARPAGPVLKLTRWIQRRPAVAASLLALSFVLAIATLVSYSSMQAAADSEQRAVRTLAEYERLADLEKLRDAIARAARLRPASPELAAKTGAWLRELGEPLAERLPQHRATLAAWIQKAELAAEREDRPEIEARIAKLESQLASLVDNPDVPIRGDEQRRERIQRDRARAKERIETKIAAERALLDASPIRYRTPEESFRAEAMLELVELLEEFSGPDGTLAKIRARDAWCRKMRARCFEEHAEAWREAQSAVAEDPRFGGMKLPILPGLVPLGADPESGLQEFGHPRSGTPPARDADTRAFVLPRGVQDTERAEDFGLVFVLIPGGRFWMGAQSTDPDEPNYDKHASADEGPVHSILLAPYLLSKYELSQAQWIRLGDGSNPSVYRKQNGDKIRGYHPVEGVAWPRIEELLRWHGMRIPTEAQWEYAARAGTTTPWAYGPELRSIRGHVNLLDRAGLGAGFPPRDQPIPWNDGAPHYLPVHAFTANRFGLHHVHGNVFEFCREWITSYEYVAIAAGDGERETSATLNRVMRGGCFMSGWKSARVSARTGGPNSGVAYVGVRPVIELPTLR